MEYTKKIRGSVNPDTGKLRDAVERALAETETPSAKLAGLGNLVAGASEAVLGIGIAQNGMKAPESKPASAVQRLADEKVDGQDAGKTR